MKFHTHPSRISLLSLSLCLGALTACTAEVQAAEQAKGATVGSQDGGTVEAPSVGPSDAAAVPQVADSKESFQAELRAKMAARMQQQQQRKNETKQGALRDADGHLVDKYGNHLDKTLPPDNKAALNAKPNKKPKQLQSLH